MELAVFTRRLTTTGEAFLVRAWAFGFFSRIWFAKFKEGLRQFNHEVLHLCWELSPDSFLGSKFRCCLLIIRCHHLHCWFFTRLFYDTSNYVRNNWLGLGNYYIFQACRHFIRISFYKCFHSVYHIFCWMSDLELILNLFLREDRWPFMLILNLLHQLFPSGAGSRCIAIIHNVEDTDTRNNFGSHLLFGCRGTCGWFFI